MAGIPMLWIAAPLSTVFWIVGSSACVVGAHAGIMEPGIES
jgi:type IV secretory pathway TrbD component